jgi:hypothetical protein
MEKTMKELVYISYTRNDSELAKYLANVLQSNEIEAWLDIKDIQSGKRVEAEIMRGLDKSTSMIVLLNESSFSSAYVRDELEYALLNNKLQNKILPVFIQERDSIDYDKLPWILRKLKFIVIHNKDTTSANADVIKREFFRLIRGR